MGRAGHALKEVARTASKVAFAAADPLFGTFPGPRILIYHQIGAGLGRQMEVTEDAFVAQLDWLEAQASVVDLETAVARRGEPDAHRLAVLTFDDGYEDLYRIGFPELRRRALPFTVYLTTHPVESGQPLTPGGAADPLTWGQVEQMAGGGLMTLGAHTHRHPDLRDLTADQIEDELATSDELIARRTGIEPRHFTYPWGYWSQTADDIVRKRYVTATLGSGRPVTSDSDPAALNRVPVQLADGVVFFKRKMRTGLRLEDRVRRRLTGYDGP